MLSAFGGLTPLQILGGVSPLFISIIVAYFAVVVGIGYWGYITTDTEEDFLVAGREIGPVVGAATLSATQLSAGTFVGLMGVHYLTGVSWAYIWPPLWLGWIISLIWIAPHMRRFGELTVPDFVAARYADDGNGGQYMRALAAVLITLVYTVYITGQYVASGLIFKSMFGIPEVWGMVFFVVIVILYTSIGGMRSSMLSDFLQLIIMGVGAVVAVPLVLNFAGGFGEVEALLASVNPKFVGFYYTPIEVATFGAAFMFSMAAAPYELVRIYSMRDEQTVRTAIGLTLIFQVIIGASLAFVSMGTRVLFPELGNPDLTSVILSINVLGPVLGALVISAVLSAMLSTIDSIMIVSASGLAHDLYVEIFNPDASDRKRLWANRIAVGIVGLIPLLLAQFQDLLGGLVQFIIVLQASMMGAMMFIPVILGLHWRKGNTVAAAVGMVAGVLAVLAWFGAKQMNIISGGILVQIDGIIPGVLVNFILFFLLSYFEVGGEPSSQSLHRFFDVEAPSSSSDD
ncbi:MAG: sodium:solute symporter [Halobacteriales archaeon]